jgi:excisionase family DNA binding protein
MSSNRKSSSKKQVEPSEWLSQAEAAKIRGVSRQAIADLVAKGRFTTFTIGGKILLKRSEVEKFKPKAPGPLPKQQHSKPKKQR